MKFFDLHRELKFNTTFAKNYKDLVDKIKKSEKERDKTGVKEYLTRLILMCHGNVTPLVPYCFPSYPKRKPMSLWSRPHSIAMMSYIPVGSLTIQASRQTGKCISGESELVLQDIGTVSIRDLFQEIKSNSL